MIPVVGKDRRGQAGDQEDHEGAGVAILKGGEIKIICGDGQHNNEVRMTQRFLVAYR